MVSYKELIGFVWQYIRLQKWTFIFVFFLDCFVWSLDALLWPYILHLVIDIFTRFEADRAAAWVFLKGPIIAGLCLFTYDSRGRSQQAKLSKYSQQYGLLL